MKILYVFSFFVSGLLSSCSQPTIQPNLENKLSVHKTPEQIKQELLNKEIKCLADNIYHEAAFEPYDGQLAVAQVTINRTHYKQYPKTICGVVYDANQFSWTKHIPPIKDDKVYEAIKKLAQIVLTKHVRSSIIDRDVLYYHATYIEQPDWASMHPVAAVIGQHVFYSREKVFEYN